MFVRLGGRMGRLVSAVPNIERPDPVCRPARGRQDASSQNSARDALRQTQGLERSRNVNGGSAASTLNDTFSYTPERVLFLYQRP